MKAAVALLLVVVAMSLVDAGTMRKRGLFKKIKGSAKHVGHLVVKQYKSAKQSFKKLVNGVDFDAAVRKLLPLIKSKKTVMACVTICVGASAAILGPAASLASIACTPLCQGALYKLEKIAG